VRRVIVWCLVVVAATACDRLRGVAAGKPPAPASTATDQEKTAIERFTTKYGAAIVRGQTDLGTIYGDFAGGGASVRLTALELINAESGERAYGLAVHVTQNDVRNNSSFVDFDEIDSLIAGFDYIKRVQKTVTSLSEFEADYRTKGDLQLAVVDRADGRRIYGVSSGAIAGSMVALSEDTAGKFREMLVRGKSMLDSAKARAPKKAGT